MNSLISAIKSFVLKSRPAYKDYLGNGKYDIKKLPEECLPDSVDNKIKIVQSSAALKENPVFTGSFSQNRKESSKVGYCSHAEGIETTASGDYSHAEGWHTTASGESSHAEGIETTASGDYSHAEGCVTTASADYSHAEGNNATASERYSHAEGWHTTASGESSHAEGIETTASGESSHAEGYYAKASGRYSHVQGKYNIYDLNEKYAHIVGNGASDTARSNAHTLDWEGNAWYAGTVEGTAMIVKSSTPDSTKKFKITVDDTGTVSATEVTT